MPPTVPREYAGIAGGLRPTGLHLRAARSVAS